MNHKLRSISLDMLSVSSEMRGTATLGKALCTSEHDRQVLDSIIAIADRIKGWSDEVDAAWREGLDDPAST